MKPAQPRPYDWALDGETIIVSSPIPRPRHDVRNRATRRRRPHRDQVKTRAIVLVVVTAMYALMLWYSHGVDAHLSYMVHR